MPFVKCKEPKARQLAVRTPRGGFHGYARQLDREHHYWSEQQAIATEEVKLGVHALAYAMHRELWQVTAGRTTDLIAPLLGRKRGEHFTERDRRRGLEAIALSLLLREIITPNVLLEDARAVGHANMFVDMVAGSDDMPLDYRMHVPSEDTDIYLPESEADDQWYRQGGLFVRRTRPAEFTDRMIEVAEEQSIAVDPASMATLYPYLRSNP